MNKRFFLVLMLLVCALSFSACGELFEPTATLAPTVTRTEGGIVSTRPPAVEGRVSRIKDDTIFLKVEGVEWELVLNEQTKWEMERFAELDMPISKGSMLIVYYREQADGVRVATKLEHVKSN